MTEIKDKGTLERFFSANPGLFAYQLGDLDDFFWPHTRWFALLDQGAPAAIALLYDAPTLPVLLALADKKQDQLGDLLAQLAPVLPGRFYCHLTPGTEDALAPRFILEPHGLHRKMTLDDPARVAQTDTRAAARLSVEDTVETRAFFDESYPGNWFDERMLETGCYFGIRADGRLVCVAGVHVFSPRYRVAALGNIATHPAYRRRGFATMATAAVCAHLAPLCDCITLNVKADNAAALSCYSRLGFGVCASYEEHMARRALDNGREGE